MVFSRYMSSWYLKPQRTQLKKCFGETSLQISTFGSSQFQPECGRNSVLLLPFMGYFKAKTIRNPSQSKLHCKKKPSTAKPLLLLSISRVK